MTLGSSIVHSTTDPAPLLHIFYILLQYQYRFSVYSAVQHRHSTSSPNTLHSITVKVPVLHIHYNSLNTQHQTYVCFPVQYRPSASPPYTVQSTTNPVSVPRKQSPTDPLPVLSEIYMYSIFLKDLVPVLLMSTSPPYTTVRDRHKCVYQSSVYNPLETQYQSVFSTDH